MVSVLATMKAESHIFGSHSSRIGGLKEILLLKIEMCNIYPCLVPITTQEVMLDHSGDCFSSCKNEKKKEM